jgi:hypothetical protein
LSKVAEKIAINTNILHWIYPTSQPDFFPTVKTQTRFAKYLSAAAW